MELLAPVGSISALKAAIHAGADAVYLGLSEHNARIKADAFNTSNLKEWVEYAHLFQVKVHVTLNTAVKDDEWDRVLYLAKIAVESGADALIVSDLGLIYALSQMTTIPIHVSTQAGVQNHLDARFAKSIGATRVILARESVDEDIPLICKEIEETETFVQGALCVSFSGGCLLGSMEYGCSGNRGVCNQACRMKYTAFNEDGDPLKTGYLLSPYDLCRGEDIRALATMGVASAKIEGRLKRAVYVYYAVAYYRAILDGNDPCFALEGLKRAFHRGFTRGYSLKKSERIINSQVPTHIGVSVGHVEKVVVKNGYKYAYLKSTHPFRQGDGAKILRNGIEVGGSDVTSVRFDGVYTVIPVSEGVKTGDEVRLTTDSAENERVERLENKLPISIVVSGKIGEYLHVVARCRDVEVSVQSASILVKGENDGKSSLKEKLSKTGNTDFYIENYEDNTEAQVFLPIKEVNAMRRELIELLRSAIIKINTPDHRFDLSKIKPCAKVERKSDVICEIDRIDAQLCGLANAYVLNLKEHSVDTLKKMLCVLSGTQCYVRLPRVARECDLSYIETVLRACPNLGIYTDSLYGVELARSYDRRYIIGYGLNVFNAKTEALFHDADHVCSSLECEDAGDMYFAGGKLPLMSFAHCPISVSYGRQCVSCDRKVDKLIYKNGEKRYLIRRNVWRDCCFTMYQDRLSLRYSASGAKLYSFVGLTAKERVQLIAQIKEAQCV